MKAEARNKMIGMLIIGLGFPHLVMPTLQPIGSKPYFVQLAVSLLVTILLWEGNLKIQKYLNIKYPWNKNAFKRIIVQLGYSGIYSNVVVFSAIFFMTMVVQLDEFTVVNVAYNIALATVMVILVTAIYEGNFFFVQWKEALTRAERLEKESVEAKYEALKNQVNPHFLFNSLNTLTNVISDNENEKAISFVQKLSNVYRYILQSNNQSLVDLEVEIKIVENYIYLLSTRFEENLKVRWRKEISLTGYSIPPLTLQMLVENAIKHNIVSSSQPLYVDIEINDSYITIANNLQKKKVTDKESLKTGLTNIKKRYQILTKEKVKIDENEQSFVVQLPLIKQKP